MKKQTDFKSLTLTTKNTKQDSVLEDLFNDGYRIAKEIPSQDFVTLILVKETEIIEPSEEVLEGEIISPPDLGLIVEETVDTHDRFGQNG